MKMNELEKQIMELFEYGYDDPDEIQEIVEGKNRKTTL